MWMAHDSLNDKIKSLVQQNFRVWHYSMTHDMMSRPIRILILSQIEKILFKIFKEYKHGHSSNLIIFFQTVWVSNHRTVPLGLIELSGHYGIKASKTVKMPWELVFNLYLILSLRRLVLKVSESYLWYLSNIILAYISKLTYRPKALVQTFPAEKDVTVLWSP